MSIEVQGETRAVETILGEIRDAFGVVPRLFVEYAIYPPLLESNWEKVKKVLMSGQLSRLLKEVLALLVSSDNSCKYCVAAHSATLRSFGFSAEVIRRMLEGDLSSILDDAQIAAVMYGRAVNRLTETGEGIWELKHYGYNDSEILEILGVVEIFSSFNRFARARNLSPDF